jgi:hypothetical protein
MLRRHVDAGIQVDRHDQFADREQAAEDQRQVVLAHHQQQQAAASGSHCSVASGG